MPEHLLGEITYHTFAALDDLGVKHAMITRHGGISPAPWATLNLASTVGDNPEHVAENVRRLTQAFDIDRESVFDVWQVHSNHVVYTETPRGTQQTHQKADAIITNRQGLTLLMRFADCVPIILYDPDKKAIGIVHAGWKGTASRIVLNAVRAMVNKYGSNPSALWAGIGPSIAAHHYEVGADVVQVMRDSFGREASHFIITENGSSYLDLWATNRRLLEKAGVRNIEVSGICTACNTNDWFSHRGENGKSGRFGVFISL